MIGTIRPVISIKSGLRPPNLSIEAPRNGAVKATNRL
jgi:hypothetical protein